MSTLERHVTPPRSVSQGLAVTAIVMLAVVAMLLALVLSELLRTPQVGEVPATVTVHVLGDCR